MKNALGAEEEIGIKNLIFFSHITYWSIMNHYLIFVATLLIANVVNGVDKEYYDAFKKLEKHAQEIKVDIDIDRGSEETITTFTYTSPNDKIKTLLKNYKNQFTKLNLKIIGSALAYGSITGCTLALGNKLFSGAENNPKLIPLGLIAIIGAIICENEFTEETPYFDVHLRKHDDIFDNVNFYTWSRIVCAMIAARLSYAGTEYALR